MTRDPDHEERGFLRRLRRRRSKGSPASPGIFTARATTPEVAPPVEPPAERLFDGVGHWEEPASSPEPEPPAAPSPTPPPPPGDPVRDLAPPPPPDDAAPVEATPSALAPGPEPEPEPLADLTDELARFAAEEEDGAAGLWDQLAEPFEHGSADVDPAAADEPGLTDNLFRDPTPPGPPLVDEPAPDASGTEPSAARLFEPAPPEPAPPEPALFEPTPAEPAAPSSPAPLPTDLRHGDMPNVATPVPAVEPASEPAPARPVDDEPSPLMDQIAREFGDPRAELHRLVDADPDELPPAATRDDAVAPAAPPVVDVLPTEVDEPSTEPSEPTGVEPEEARGPDPVDETPPDETPADETPAEESAADEDEPTSPQPIPLSEEPATHGPSTIRVHDERLDNRPGPIRMSPSEAVTLANEGPAALRRRRPRT